MRGGVGVPAIEDKGEVYWGWSTRSQLALYSALSGGSNTQRQYEYRLH